jgi:hypothetical protein
LQKAAAGRGAAQKACATGAERKRVHGGGAFGKGGLRNGFEKVQGGRCLGLP